MRARLLAAALCAGLLTVGRANPAMAAADSVLVRVGGDITARTGQYIDVPITVDLSGAPGRQLGSYRASLSFNPAILEFVSADIGSFAAPQVNSVHAADSGKVLLDAIQPSGASGAVTIFIARFYVLADSTSSPVTISFDEMSATALSVTPFETLLPLLRVVNGTFCRSLGRWGDVNNDGQVNSLDALVALSVVVGIQVDTTTMKPALADVDGDGRVTSRDALIMLSYAVGLPVGGYRVLLPAAGACGTGAATTLAVFPGAAQLVPTQTLRLLLQASDSAGRAVPVASPTWTSSDYGVAGVDAGGNVQPRAPGTAVITAELAPGERAFATITVVARRPNWYVDLRATGVPIQLGTAAYPFEHPLRAYPMVAEGDTIRVTPGTYFFIEDGELNAGVVILGGTPGDTTTRPTFVDPSGYYSALWLRGGARTVVRNVVFQNFYEAADLDGVRNFAMEDVKVLLQGSASGYGIYSCASVTMDTVRVDRSVFLGDSAYRYGTAIYYSGCTDVSARVTMVRDSKIRFWGDAVELYDSDSTVVLRSEISDNDGYGIALYQEYNVTPSLYMAHSRMERNYYEAIYGYPFRRLVVDSSVIRSTEDDGIDVEGGCCGSPPMQLYLHGDSIYMEHYADDYDWLLADYADSVVVDSTVVRFPADTGSFYAYGEAYANQARVTNSKFLNVGAGTVLYFDGGAFSADSVEMTGCLVASCDGASGFDLYFSGSGARAEIQRSRFTQIGYPIYAYGAVQSVRNVVIDSAWNGIEMYGTDSTTVTNNVLRRIGGTGIMLGTSGGPLTVRVDSNGISGAAGTAVQIGTAQATLTGNNIRNNAGYGLDFPNLTGYVSQVHNNAFFGNALYAVRAGYDSVDATNNWWGDAAGPGPGVVADSVSGRIATNPWLSSEPSGLPALAPPMLALRGARAAAAVLPLRGVERPRPTARAARAPREGARIAQPPAGGSPQRLAGMQRAEGRRAAQAARDATHRAQRDAQRQTRRADAAARRANVVRAPQ